jgi:hypothetical protein
MLIPAEFPSCDIVFMTSLACRHGSVNEVPVAFGETPNAVDPWKRALPQVPHANLLRMQDMF